MRKLIVGLTGGIGAGKSLVLAEFSRLGAAAVSADQIAHRLARRGGAVHRGVVRAFGAGVLDARGEIDRRKLGELACRRPAARRRLEALTHPPILKELGRLVRAARRPVVVADVPLLFEGGHEGRFDLTLAVSAPPEVRLARIRRRDRLSAAEARRRLAAQLPEAERRRRADVVLPNEGTPRALRARVREYYKAFELISRSPAGPYGG